MGRKAKVVDGDHFGIVLSHRTVVMLDELARKAGMTRSEKIRLLMEPLVESIYEEEIKSQERREELSRVSPLFKPEGRKLVPLIPKEKE